MWTRSGDISDQIELGKVSDQNQFTPLVHYVIRSGTNLKVLLDLETSKINLFNER